MTCKKIGELVHPLYHLTLLSPLFLLLLEAIFTGYIPLVGFFPSPASAFTCAYITTTITTLFSILVFHYFLHVKYTRLYILCQEKSPIFQGL
jgi:hypothetical protein